MSTIQTIKTKPNALVVRTEGQYSGKMLAETGSFDILLGNWVLGIGFFHKYISIYIYIYKYILG